MGFLVRMGLLAGVGALVYKMYHKKDANGREQEGEPVFSSGVTRNAGPDAQQDPDTDRKWDKIDQQSDESFPASDPPANY